MDTDPNFMIFRRFGFLRIRLILNQQDKLAAFETDLDYYDRTDDNGSRSFVRSRLADMNRPERHRQDLFAALHSELKLYGMLPSAMDGQL